MQCVTAAETAGYTRENGKRGEKRIFSFVYFGKVCIDHHLRNQRKQIIEYFDAHIDFKEN